MAKLRAFSFRYGTSEGKMCWYRVEDDARNICVRIDQYDGVQMDTEYIVTDEAFLIEAAEMIEKTRIRDWNGFYDIENTVCNGAGWVLHVYYHDEEEIHAMGHTAYPEGFEEGKQEMIDIFRRFTMTSVVSKNLFKPSSSGKLKTTAEGGF